MKAVHVLALSLLLAAGCLTPSPPADPAALKAEALSIAKEDPAVYKLLRFQEAFNDPDLRAILSPEQDQIKYDFRFEALTWGEGKFKVAIYDSIGGKENDADLWVIVALQQSRRVVDYSDDLRPDSRFMDAVSRFLLAPDGAKQQVILDSVAKFVPITSCEQWGAERDKCYGYLATIRNNPYVCDEIVDFDGKFTCVAAVTKHVPRCDAVTFNSQASCRILSITLTKNCLEYDPVKHEGETASLQDRCLVLLPEKATAFGPSLCDMISDPAYKLRCLHSIAFNHADNAVCDGLEGMERKVCRALALRDVKYCQKPAGDAYEPSCVILLAKKAQNEEFCGVLDGQSQDDCLKEAAIAKQDPGLCERITPQSPEARKWCYTFTSEWTPSKLIKGYIPFTALLPTGISR